MAGVLLAPCLLACSAKSASHADARGPVADASHPEEATGSVLVAEETGLCDGCQTTGLVSAHFYAQPEPQWFAVVEQAGPCRYLEYRVGFCEPACAEFCTADNRCVSWPQKLSVGTLSISGLAQSVAIQPDDYATYSATLPLELFDAGATVSASAPGDALPGFSTSSAGVAPLDPVDLADEAGVAHMVRGQPMTVRWAPAQPAARVRLLLRSPTVGHGLPSTAIIECDGLDTGEFVIPTSMVDSFPSSPGIVSSLCFGRDCPTSILARYQRSSVEIEAGTIELRVESRATFALLSEDR